MATALTTITNISNQAVPILVNSISLNKANSSSNIAAAKANSTLIQPGAQLRIETQRIDLGQLERLRNLKLITFV